MSSSDEYTMIDGVWVKIPPKKVVSVVVISDTHTFHNRVVIPPGDILIHCGDFCSTGRLVEADAFAHWMSRQPHAHKIVIAGNHDICLEHDRYLGYKLFEELGVTYLFDEETTACGLRFYGSPWQPEFHDWAFNLPRGEKLREKWAKIPKGIDVLMTHGPPYGILDLAPGDRVVGCEELIKVVMEIRPQLHAFGHIHEGYGKGDWDGITFANASICTGLYQPTNAPLTFNLQPRST